MGLATLTVAGAGTWRRDDGGGIACLRPEPGGRRAAAVLDLWLGYLGAHLGGGHYYGYVVLPRALLVTLLLDLLVLLGAWIWLRPADAAERV